MEKYNQEAIKYKLKIVNKIQSKFPDLILGGSLASYVLGYKYKEPHDIDIYTENCSIDDLLGCIGTYKEVVKSSRTDTQWQNGKFKMHIEHGYSVGLKGTYLDFKKVRILPPYSFITVKTNWQGIEVITASKEILEQGIRAFQNYCLDRGALHVLEGKYKNINDVFRNREQLI